jgi:hypothetical protein
MGPATSILAAGALTATAQVVRGQWPSPRLIAGVGIAGAVMLAFAGQNPAIAQRFGTLVLLTSLVVNGVDVAKAANNALNRPYQSNPPGETS